MYQPSQGQIDFIRGGIKQNIRNDGRSNNEYREIMIKKGILPQANGSSFIKVFGSYSGIYTGIKLDIGTSPYQQDKSMLQGQIKICIDSMRRRDNNSNSQSKGKINESIEESSIQSDNFLLKHIAGILDELLIKQINKTCLALPQNKFIILNIDVFLLDYVNLSFIDLIAIGVKAALEDLEIPDITVQHNILTNEDEIGIIEDKLKRFSIESDFQIPYIFTIGELEGHFIYDMTQEEYYSVESIYLASLKKDGTILQLQKVGKGYISPENIFKISNCLQEAVINRKF